MYFAPRKLNFLLELIYGYRTFPLGDRVIKNNESKGILFEVKRKSMSSILKIKIFISYWEKKNFFYFYVKHVISHLHE